MHPFQTSTSKRPLRPCVFCGVLVKESFRNRHKEKTNHIFCVFTEAEKKKALADLRNEGIKKYNEKVAEESGEMEGFCRARRSRSKSNKDLKMCSGCSIFLSAKKKGRHRCTVVTEGDTSFMKFVPGLQSTNANLAKILCSMKSDSIGVAVKTNTDILRIWLAIFQEVSHCTERTGRSYTNKVISQDVDVNFSQVQRN